MKRNVFINADFDYLREYIENIPGKFDTLGKVVYDRRNITRIDGVGDRRLVIKSYRRIYLTNRIRYTYFYSSKAQRAYDYATLLLKKGFNTPRPIAYIECFKNGLINQSYFVSEYTDFLSLDSILKTPEYDLKDLLADFARYTYKLHQNGIYHVDYSTGNILFKKIDNQYQFALIDNNRMKFGPITFNKGIKNLERLGLPVEQLTSIGKEYARQWGVNEIVCMERLFHYRRKQMRKGALKRSIKNFRARLQSLTGLFGKTTRQTLS